MTAVAEAVHGDVAARAPRPIRRVHFVEFNAKVNTLAVSPLFPKYGTPLLAAILHERGYDVRIFLEGVSDMRLERLTDCDAVCLPVFAPALNKVRACAAEIRRKRPDLPIIAGGPQVNLFPDSVLDVCTYAVRCEGDDALPELLDRLSRGADPRGMPGISFLDGGRPQHNPDSVPPTVPDTAPDLTLIDGFERARRRLGWHRVVNALQTSRGCHFRCRFCPTARLFGGTYRTRSIDSVIADIRSRIHLNPVFFVVDNSFLGNRKHSIELLYRLTKENLGARFIVFERHQIGRDDEILQLMKRAGVCCVIVGIESLSDENLQFYDKRQTSEAVSRSVERILEHDMHVIGTFVLGGDGDTRESADRIVQFVEATRISLNLFIVHDLESDEWKGLIIPLNRRFQTYYQRTAPGCPDPWDYLTGSFVTYFPSRMKPSTLQQCVLDVYERVFSHGSIMRRMVARNTFEATFGIVHGYGVKRLTDSIRAVVDGGYMDHLRRLEDGLYDEQEVLVEERLASLEGLPLPKPLTEQASSYRYEALVPILAAPGLVRAKLARHRQTGRR